MLRFLLFFLVFFGVRIKAVDGQSQTRNPELQAYRFAEGWRLNGLSGSTLRLSGFVQPSLTSTLQSGDTLEAWTHRYRMRRIRLRLDGKGADPRFGYRIQADLSGTGEELDGNSNYLLDAYVTWDPSPKWSVTLGQRAPYTDNRELWMQSYAMHLVERSRLTSVFASIREFGLFVDGVVRLPGGVYLKPYFCLTNGDGLNQRGPDRGGIKWGGRLDVLPFGLFTAMGQFHQPDLIRERTPKLVLGATSSYNQGISDRRGRESGAILYLDPNGQSLLPDFAKVGFDFLFKYQGFSLLGEWMKTGASIPTAITQRVRTDGSIAQDFPIEGLNNMDAYLRNRMMLGSALNIQGGYMFKKGFSLDGRYTQLQGDRYSFMNNATFYNRPRYYTLGFTVYSGRHYGARWQSDLTWVDNDGGIANNQGILVQAKEWIIRSMVTFAF